MMQKYAVHHVELFKIPQEQEQCSDSETAVYLAKDVEKALNRPDVWSQEEANLLVTIFMKAEAKHGLTESLFAVVAAYLDHKRASVSANEKHE
jgi:hypothetical protein